MDSIEGKGVRKKMKRRTCRWLCTTHIESNIYPTFYCKNQKEMMKWKGYKEEGITISRSSFSGGSACGASRYNKCAPDQKGIKLYIDGME